MVQFGPAGAVPYKIVVNENTVEILWPDGKTLASVSIDKTVKFWNVEDGKEIRSLSGQPAEVAFSPDGKTLASGGSGKGIRLWNVEDGKEIRSFPGHDSWVNSLAFSPDGKTLASGTADGLIKLWQKE